MKIRKNNIKINYVLLYIAILFLLFITLFPFYLVFVNSLQTHLKILRGETRLIPLTPTLKNYIALFKVAGGSSYSVYILNSLKVAIGVSLISTILSSMAAYSLSHYRFLGKEVIGKILLLIYVFPTMIIVVPVYDLLSKVGLNDSHLGLILIQTAIVAPFCTWLLRSFFEAIPKEVEEAAFIDGCNKWQSFLHITFPMAGPGILTAAIYAMVFSWGEYTFALIIIDSGTKKTLPLALSAFMQTYGNIEWGKLLASTSLNIFPILIIFLILAKNFLKGFMEGALK
jgi:ABC-type glycerol-3-phosphate transport system permease component